jgi:hypothetical protein
MESLQRSKQTKTPAGAGVLQKNESAGSKIRHRE